MMKDKLFQIKIDMMLSAILCAVLGMVIFVWPDKTIDFFGRSLAIGLMIMGGINLFSYFKSKRVHPFSGTLGAILVLVGLWIFLKPESVASLIPIVIGVILLIHGAQDVKFALESRRNGYERWWTMLLIAAVSLGAGILCIVNAFGVVKLALKFIGIALIYDGVSDLWIAAQAARTVKDRKEEWIVTQAARAAKEEKEELDVLDVDYREVDDE